LAWNKITGAPATFNAGQLQGRTLAATLPSDLQYLGWNSAAGQWEPKTLAGAGVSVATDGTTAGTGTTLNFVTGPGLTNSIVPGPGQINLQIGLDTAVIASLPELQSGSALFCGSASNSTSSYQCSLNPTASAYTAGMILHWRPDLNGAGGATTLDVDQLGAVPLKQADGTTNPGGTDIVAGRLYELWFDGTAFRIMAGMPGSLADTAVPGSLLYANPGGAWAQLPGNASTGRRFLAQTGNGSAAGTPVWVQPAAADIGGLASSATIDTTNASNLSSGTLPWQRLPPPGASTLGGVQAKDCSVVGGQPGHVQKINADGSITCYLDGAAGGGGTANPGGSSGQVQFNNGGTFGGFTVTGDAAINTSTGVLTIRQVHRNAGTVSAGASPYAVKAADSYLSCDASAGPVALNLPAAAGTGREFLVKKTDSSSNACSVSAAGADLIDGASAAVLSAPNASATLIDRAIGTWDRLEAPQFAGDIGGMSSNAVVTGLNGGTIPALAAVLGTNSGKQPVAATADNLSAPIYCADTGSANTITCSHTPALAGYTRGTVYRVKVAAQNTGATTVNFDFLGTKTVVTPGLQALTGGELCAGQIAEFSYDGANMEMLSQRCNSMPRDGLSTAGGYIDIVPDASITFLKDDFTSVNAMQSELYWGNSGGTQAQTATLSAGHPGVVSIQTGSLSGNAAYKGLTSAANAPWTSLGSSGPFSSWTMTWIATPCNESGCTTSGAAAAMAMCVSATASGSNTCPQTTAAGIAMEADTAPVACSAGSWNTANWMYVTSNGTSMSCLDSGVPFNYATWHKFTISSTAPGTIRFCIDGSNCQDSSTYIPNGPTTAGTQVTTRTAAAKSELIDFFSFKGRGLTR
jgi:hypothetical protein